MHTDTSAACADCMSSRSSFDSTGLVSHVGVSIACVLGEVMNASWRLAHSSGAVQVDNSNALSLSLSLLL